jgi:hypothetical protein
MVARRRNPQIITQNHLIEADEPVNREEVVGLQHTSLARFPGENAVAA